MPVLFKLKFGDETRRVTFPELPSWATLSSRLTALYGVPADKLGVSYTDLDSDEITLNTEEELLDYYETSNGTRPGEALRLRVVDLTLLRSGLSATPRVEPLAFEVDDDWQKFPSVHVLSSIDLLKDPSLDNTHAFVEILNESTPSIRSKPLVDVEDDRDSIASTVQGLNSIDKGKQRESLSFPSTTSLIDEETGEKHPIHVMDRSTIITTFPPDELGLESTKDIRSHDAGPRVVTPQSAPVQTTDGSDHVDDDPPLPTIDATTSDNAHSSSLTEDIAALLGTLNSAVAANPQLGETFQRIMHNTRSGAYWRDHRDSLHQTVQNMTHAMGTATDEFRRNAEAEAARNISQLLGNLFQALSIPLQEERVNRDGSDHPTATENHEADEHGNAEGSPRSIPGAFPHHPRDHGHRWRGRGRHFRHSWGVPGMPPHHHHHPPPPPVASSMPPPPPPPPHPAMPRIPPHPGMPGLPPPPPPPPPPSMPGMPPPPPPPAGHLGSFNPFGHFPPLHGRGWGPFGSFPPPPPTGYDLSLPHAPPRGPPRFSGIDTSPGQNEEHPPSDRIWDPELRPSWLPPPPPIESQTSEGRPSPQELLASVTAAKEKYKEEKERYRREKHELRKLRQERRSSGMTPAAGPSSSLPVSREPSHEEHREVELPVSPAGVARSNTYLVSHARGPFPQLEMVSASPAPRRSATISGGERRAGSEDQEFQDARVLGRISRKLFDMGFTEVSDPSLPEKIRAQLPKDTRTVTKAMEDEIVTNLLEDLLSRVAASRSPIASGSGIQREQQMESVPGGWQH